MYVFGELCLLFIYHILGLCFMRGHIVARIFVAILALFLSFSTCYAQTTTLPVALRQVSNRVAIFTQKSASQTQSGWRAWEINYVPVVAIRVAIGAWYVPSRGGETCLGGPISVRISVEYPRGVFTPNYSNIIADCDTGYIDVPVVIPAYAEYRINGDFYMPAGGTVPSNAWSDNCDRGNGDEYQVGPSGYGHTRDSLVLGTGPVGCILPQAVLGLSNKSVWVAVGDSLTAGVNDDVPDPSGGRGLFGRALAKRGPYVNYGVPGDMAALYSQSNNRRLALIRDVGATNAILQLGINDIYSGSRTDKNVIADRATIRSKLISMGLRVYDTTLTPVSLSTDNWQTAINQSPAGPTTSSPYRIAFNTALRSGALLAQGSSGTLDIARYVETSPTNNAGPVLNGGVFIPGYVGYADGIHLNPRGLQAIEPMVSQFVSTRR
jgi:lysophospholipase L1-like esterase